VKGRKGRVRAVKDNAEGGKTLLVLDDEPDARDIVKFIFEPRGYRVYTRGDGAEALELLCRERVAVVLVDLLMPGMDGKEFLRELQLLAGEIRPVAIVNSARKTEEVKREVENLDVFDIITKPYELREIEERVDRAFAEKVRRLSG
jgi:CheY-like chemotaxis protein